jgi:hypothetical protein
MGTDARTDLPDRRRGVVMGPFDREPHEADPHANVNNEAGAAITGYAIGRLLARQAEFEAAAGTWGIFSILHRPGRYLARRENGLADQLGKASHVPDLKALPALAWGARSGWSPAFAVGLTGLALVGAPDTIGGPTIYACAVFDPLAHGHVLAADTSPKWHQAPVPTANCAVAQGLLEVLAGLRAMPSTDRR